MAESSANVKTEPWLLLKFTGKLYSSLWTLSGFYGQVQKVLTTYRCALDQYIYVERSLKLRCGLSKVSVYRLLKPERIVET